MVKVDAKRYLVTSLRNLGGVSWIFLVHLGNTPPNRTAGNDMRPNTLWHFVYSWVSLTCFLSVWLEPPYQHGPGYSWMLFRHHHHHAIMSYNANKTIIQLPPSLVYSKTSYSTISRGWFMDDVCPKEAYKVPIYWPSPSRKKKNIPEKAHLKPC